MLQGLENNVKYIEMNGLLIEKVFAKSFAVQFPRKCSDILLRRPKWGVHCNAWIKGSFENGPRQV